MFKSACVAAGTSPTAVELSLEIGAFRFLSFFSRFRPGYVRGRIIVFLALRFSLAAFSFIAFTLVSLRTLALRIIPFSFGCPLVSLAFVALSFVTLVAFLLVKGVSLRSGVSHFRLK